MKLKQTQGLSLIFYILLIILSTFSTSCEIRLRRVTTVYGRVIDEAKQPVDSILIFLGSSGFSKAGITLAETFSDQDGNYSFTLDVPKGYGAVTVGIPYDQNPKFTENYSGMKVFENSQQTNSCCSAAIGSKTHYDFLLINK
ncbi:hypothetical protein [Arundinibacter roseus]|uniref:Carboxypeptidase regulatory-like domain-containing protein n=1 Tax=Arundinibacter roseus TaxID=2070510 RepID=A0A4V2X9D9_9BACT|nr:hypothetical protein [Arundinibacter roseus]TDB63315.1 hypothetical protein EZE20_16205 [Arundinibacter roseus]